MYLLFDIGGTKMRLAVSKNGQAIDDIKIIPLPQNFDEGIQKIKELAKELLNGQEITEIAGGIAGPLDKNKSTLIASPHIRDWINKPLKETLEQTFRVRVILENDATLSSLGEAVYGGGKDYKIVGYVGIGTGVGGAKIINGKVEQTGLGFEIGHQIIEINGKPCHCGGRGHLECYVAGGYFKENFDIETANISDDNKKEISHFLAIGLNNLAVAWSPEVIILGGSVMNSLSLELIQQNLDKVLTIFPQKIKLLKHTYLGN